jgi:hypothetical protein
MAESDASLAAAMASEEFRTQMRRWRGEADELRAAVREGWAAATQHPEGDVDGAGAVITGHLFRAYWSQATLSVRTALVVTALQELPDSEEVRAMLPVVAPELSNPGPFVREDDVLPVLLSALAHEKENENAMSKFGLDEDDDGSISFDGPVGFDAMSTIRSCILLKFGAAIMMIYLAEAEGDPESDDA